MRKAKVFFLRDRVAVSLADGRLLGLRLSTSELEAVDALAHGNRSEWVRETLRRAAGASVADTEHLADAADSAGMPLSQWARVVLRVAADVGDLAEQIERVRH